MLLCTVARSTLNPGTRARASARYLALAWSSRSRGIIVRSATRPGAAMMPAWRMAPPNDRRTRFARSMNVFVPASSDPTGADSPFDRQTQTESTERVSSRASTPRATAALNTRAPSRWTANPASCATAASASDLVRRQHGPAGRVVRVLQAQQAGRREHRLRLADRPSARRRDPARRGVRGPASPAGRTPTRSRCTPSRTGAPTPRRWPRRRARRACAARRCSTSSRSPSAARPPCRAAARPRPRVRAPSDRRRASRRRAAP